MHHLRIHKIISSHPNLLSQKKMSSFEANTNRVTITESGKLVRLISSEGEAFDVPVEFASLSEHIKMTLEMSAEEDLPTMDLPTVDSRTLRAIIAFMREYAQEPYPEIPYPLPEAGLYSILRPFYQDFLNIKMIDGGLHDTAVFTGEVPENSTTLVLLLVAANNLTIPSLKALITNKMVDTTRGKNIKDMFQIFDIPDHVPKWEDMERIRKEHDYAFKRPINPTESAARAAADGNEDEE